MRLGTIFQPGTVDFEFCLIWERGGRYDLGDTTCLLYLNLEADTGICNWDGRNEGYKSFLPTLLESQRLVDSRGPRGGGHYH